MMKLVHNRELSIRTYDLGDYRLLVEGCLTDHVHRSRHGEPLEEPELVHDMVLRLKIRGPQMLIDKAEATMPHHPNKECTVILPWIKNLKGLRIASGFTMKVKEVIGSTKGCAHLTSLVIAMGASAVQGYWAAYGIEGEKRGLDDEAVRKIINTCYVWRKDGPLVKRLREASKVQGSVD